MTHVEVENGDAAEFIAEVNAIVEGVVSEYQPPELVLVRIDNWFGPNWLQFSGKVLGALGVWKETLTVPPFVPNRVVWQRQFDAPAYSEKSESSPIHVAVPSDKARFRRLSQVVPGAAVVWFTGNTARNDQGAVMSYVPTGDSYWAWYAGFRGGDGWRSVELKGIVGRELSALARAGRRTEEGSSRV